VTPIVRAGTAAAITWNASNVQRCIASGAWSGGKNVTGKEISATLNQDTTYTLVCTGDGGAASSTATVVVVKDQSTTKSILNAIGSLFSK